ncbi:MAG: Omp28-related outer membrane protein [Bacteroidetes bacterium]|nr:MAG: Omp28-related outer membrane protein [Bacteroidota bacterium]
MLNRINKFGTIIAFILISFYACDEIDAPYRDKDNAAAVAGVNYIDESNVSIDGDTFSFPIDNSIPPKKVLAEDYTGTLCGNCPYAGEKLNDTIKPGYGDRLVVISVHSGFFANPCPAGFACPPSRPAGALETDFRTSIGNDWDVLFGNSNAGNPNGLIDRMDYPSSHIKAPAVWAAKVQERSQLAATFGLRILRSYDASSKKLKVAVQSRAIGNQTGSYKMQVVLTEDSIIDWQYWYPPVSPAADPHFLHRSVLRSGVNSTFGEEISAGGFSNGDLVLKGYNATIDPSWKEKNVRVVAFIFNAITYEVKQVEEISLMP